MTRRIMREFSIDEISAVDRPAQAGAKMTIMKRESAPDGELVAKRAMLTTNISGHSHLVVTNWGDSNMISGDTSYTDRHDHPWVQNEDGSITIGAASGHTHTVIESPEEDEAGEAVQKKKPSVVNSDATIDKRVGYDINKEDNTMTEDELKDHVIELEKSQEKYKSIIDMPAVQRAYYDGLSDHDKPAFLDKSAGEQVSIMKAASEADAVMYTADDGSEYLKSDDPRLVAMAKRGDVDRKARVDADAKVAESELQKRATAELSHLPGDLSVHTALLKAVDGIDDEKARMGAMEVLKSKDSRAAESFQTYGHVAAKGDSAGNGTAEQDLDALAKKYAAEHKVTEPMAYDQVLKTKEGAALYKLSYN